MPRSPGRRGLARRVGRRVLGLVLFAAIGALVAGAGWAASASMRSGARAEAVGSTTQPPRRGLVTVLAGSVPDRSPVSTIRGAVGADAGMVLALGVAAAAIPTMAAPTTTTSAPATITTARPSTPVVTAAASTRQVTGVGDSIMLGASAQLKAAVTGELAIDAKVGRSFAEGLDAVKELAKQHALGEVVVVHLGTNNGVTVTQLRSMLDKLKTVPIVLLVNVRVPRDWQTSTNATLASVSRSYRNVRLVDWFSATDGHPELFASDGYHLLPEGSAFYATLIADAMNY